VFDKPITNNEIKVLRSIVVEWQRHSFGIPRVRG
jgi:hypothetical protein